MSTTSKALNPAPDTVTVPAGCPPAADMTMPGVTVNLAVLAAVPPGAVTETRPVDADVGTVAVILVFEFTVNWLDAAGLPKVTAVAPVNPEPVM